MKNKIKFIALTLITVMLFSLNSVFGYDITFLGKYLDPTNSQAGASSIKSFEDYYADVYLYFCAKSYGGHGDTSGGWVTSSSDSETTKTFPNGSNVQYDNSYVNFTGLIKFDKDETLTSVYGGSGSTKDTWANGQEMGTFQVVYDSYNEGKSGDVDIVYPDGEKGKVTLKDSTIIPDSSVSAQTVIESNFSPSTTGIQADSSTLNLGSASTIGQVSFTSRTKAAANRIGYNISLAGGNYSLYKARRTGRYNESIEVLSSAALKQIVEKYTENYKDQAGDGEDAKLEIMKAISEDGIRFSRTCSATNPYADTRVVHNMDTAARAIYGMQAGVTWTSHNLGYNDNGGYGKGDGTGVLDKSEPVRGASAVNHFDNIIIIPFNAVEEKDYEIYIQYKKMEFDDTKKEEYSKAKDKTDYKKYYKEMEDAPEFADNELVKAKNTTSNKYAKIEVETTTEGEETFYEKAKVKAANYKITAKKSFELNGEKWKIVLDECKWSIGESLSEAAKSLGSSSNVLQKNSFEYEFGKDKEKKSEIMAIRIVYKNEPEEEEEEEPDEFEKTLGPIKPKGILQFVNMTLTDDFSFAVSQNWADGGKTEDEILSAGSTSFSEVFNFYKSTKNESEATSDYIASGEYLTPYMTDAYYYVVRALGWKVHDESLEIGQKTISVERDYYYTVIWGNLNSDSRTIPTNMFQFTWRTTFPLVWRTEDVCPFKKDRTSYTNRGGTYNKDTESTTVEGETLYGAYYDHTHGGYGSYQNCCPGKEMETVNRWSGTATCTREVTYYSGTYFVQTNPWGGGYTQSFRGRTLPSTVISYTSTTGPCNASVNITNGTVVSKPTIYHITSEVQEGDCYNNSTITSSGSGTVTGASATCSYYHTETYNNVSVTMYGTATQSGQVNCGYPYGQASDNKASTYTGHQHTANCFKKIKNKQWILINTTVPDSYYTDYVKKYDEDNPTDDPSNHPLTSGINATNRIENDTKTSQKKYDFNYVLKYYEIKNFKMYKISKMEFKDMSGTDEVFEEDDTFEIEPSEKYNETFENSENGIKKPERSHTFELESTLDVASLAEDSEPKDSNRKR